MGPLSALYSAGMGRSVLLPVCLLVGALTLDARAGDLDPPAPDDGPPSQQEEPSIGLDSLLRPRSDFDVAAPQPSSELPGGRNREQWTKGFAEARAEVGSLEQRVSGGQEKIREASGEDWGYTPIGAGAPSDPEMLKLRAQLKRDRQSLETARARLRDLEVEASLSGVPDSWRALPESD